MISIDVSLKEKVCAGCGDSTRRVVTFLATDDELALCDECAVVLRDMLDDDTSEDWPHKEE